MSDTATIYIVDDNEDWRDSLQWLFESVGIGVKAYPGAREFLDAFKPADYGCVILDIRMPGMSGLELQQELAALTRRLHIIFVTGHASVPTAVRAMREGAVDFFEKPLDEQALLDRVQSVLRDIEAQRACDAKNAILEQALNRLTPREHEVLDWLVAGIGTREIADRLNISVRTIESHRSAVLAKTGFSSMSDLLIRINARRVEGREVVK